jgi:hypothetical protein
LELAIIRRNELGEQKESIFAVLTLGPARARFEPLGLRIREAVVFDGRLKE